MTAHENKTALPLVHLGITRPEELSALFADLRGRFDADCASAQDESSWKQFRDAWLGRKSGVLTQITDNWLKPSTLELKRAAQPSSPVPKKPPWQVSESTSLSPASFAPSAPIT